MSSFSLEHGERIQVETGDDRIGSGPWARWLASAVVPDESSARAERGRGLARSGAVHAVVISAGSIAARVTGSDLDDYLVTIEAATIPESVWREVARAAHGRPALEPGVEGSGQSIHLAHLMETERREPLVPTSRRIRTACTCPDRDWVSVCKHVAAVAFVVADAVDRDPSLLLRWRGCEPVEPPASRSDDPWLAGPLPAPRAPRSLPPGAVVKRLGRSGIRVGSVDLAEALEPAYRVFAGISASTGVQ